MVVQSYLLRFSEFVTIEFLCYPNQIEAMDA